MSYQSLFNEVQSFECLSDGQDFEICQEKLTVLAESETGKDVIHLYVEMDTEICRGLFCHATNLTNELFSTGESNVILTANGLKSDLEKVVFTKELMHIFEPPNGTNTDTKLRRLLGDLSYPSQPFSKDMRSEVDSFWRGLSLLCVEDDRARLVAPDSDVGAKGLAKRFNIPEQYAEYYSRPNYLDLITRLGARLG